MIYVDSHLHLHATFSWDAVRCGNHKVSLQLKVNFPIQLAARHISGLCAKAGRLVTGPMTRKLSTPYS